jgi:hypothetical protein
MLFSPKCGTQLCFHAELECGADAANILGDFAQSIGCVYQLTTMFTSFRGTTIIFLIALPSTKAFTFSADFAAASKSA